MIVADDPTIEKDMQRRLLINSAAVILILLEK
jgi:hypothetical protein